MAVIYELNDEEITTLYPIETWHSGKHILTLYYPVESVIPDITNTFRVYLRMEGGTGTVDVGDAIASISGQSMAAAAAWDGKITVEETVGLFFIGGGLLARAFVVDIRTETMELVQKFYSETISRIPVGAFAEPIEV